MLFGLFLEQIFGQWLVRASSGGFAAPNQSVSKSQPSDSRNYPAGGVGVADDDIHYCHDDVSDSDSDDCMI